MPRATATRAFPLRRRPALALVVAGLACAALPAIARQGEPATAPVAPSPAPAAAPPPAEPAPTASPNAARCPEQAGLLDQIGQLLGRRPDDATLYFWRARGWAQCGQVAEVVADLGETLRRGKGFLPVADTGFERIWDDPAFRARYQEMEAALPRAVAAEPAFRLTRTDLIPEGIAWDAAARRLLVGSLARGEIVAVEEDGTERTFAAAVPGMTTVLGLAVDAARGSVYAVVTSGLATPAGGAAANALLELDANSGALRRRLDATGAGQLNDVAVAPDGTVYVTDSATGALYRAGRGDTALARWPSAEVALFGANGIAVAPGGAALYVAHGTSIGRLELPGGAMTPRLGNATGETLAAIDGLYARGRTLIGVQNVTNPGRVVELTLDEAGGTVVAARTLLSHHHPALAEPTTGAVAGERFLLLANSFVGRLQPDGTVRDPATVTAPVILAIDLAGGAR